MISDNEKALVPESEIQLDFVRSSGPGGQNVNKVSTAVHLRFDVEHSPSLPDLVRRRLIRLAGKRVDSEGVLHIQASSYRTQIMNRQDAMKRLNELIEKAKVVPKKRIKTNPSAASKEKILEVKRHVSQIKSLRKTVRDLED